MREEFDYPVFVAAPKSVGITSTGETGENVPNELPALLEAYRGFEAWSKPGPSPRRSRVFSCPPLPDPPVEGSRALDHRRRCRAPAFALPADAVARVDDPAARGGDRHGRLRRLDADHGASDRRDFSARSDRPYKGSMFAVYPGDIVFSKIDARSGAIGMLPA